VLGALGLGLFGAVACGGQGKAMHEKPGDEIEGDARMHTKTFAKPRMPVVFLPHGGGPWPFVEMGLDAREHDALLGYLREVAKMPPEPPKALLVISAHWEARVPTVMTHPRPPMLYDYYGFPEAAYHVTWPAPGAPELAARVRELLGAAGFGTAVDEARGFDHGTFVPLKLTYPNADIPTTQLSLKTGLDPAEHLAIGRALAPLRDEGVFILGSGMTFHDLRAFFNGGGRDVAETFDAWLVATTTASPNEREARLRAWAEAPMARRAHPREEHLLPLMVVVGAAGEDAGVVDYRGTFMGLRLSAHRFGGA
jgi:aromatic ring-opening dioxygenase catalytic subunit (LigB family)